MTLYDLATGNDSYTAGNTNSRIKELEYAILNSTDKRLIAKLQVTREKLLKKLESDTLLYNMCG